mgnify:CR=1 FL=1
MFAKNKYTILYYKLIEKYGNSENKEAENHHIIPKSMGGSNKRANITRVPSRVHFILHKLLCKMVIEPKHLRSMHFALWQMMNRRICYYSSRDYEHARVSLRTLMTENNPMHNEEVKSKLRGRKRPDQSDVARKRNIQYWSDRARPLRTFNCEICGKEMQSRVPQAKTCCRAHADDLKRKIAAEKKM